MLSVLIFLLGSILGAGMIFLWLNKNHKQLTKIKTEKEETEKQQEKLFSENQTYKEKEKNWIEKSSSLKAKYENLQQQLEIQNKYHEEKLKDQKTHYEEKIQEREKHFKQLTEKANIEFQNIANKIFSDNTKSYKDESAKKLTQILEPFKEDIEIFKKSVQGQEKFLSETITRFTNINLKMRDDTIKLTQTLRGDTNSQGQWGEFVLANILEKSGLRKGEDFIVQEKLKDEEGLSLRPDVIIKLPEQKHIVIDSKVSFTHYNEYISSKKEEERSELLKKILNSIRSHIDNLSSKKYQDSEGLKSPDFTLMFIPNEGIFSIVTQAKDLFEKAWKQRIVIVGPTTLFATLRTIASIWKIEKQNKYAKEVAKRGKQLYDKFVGFLEDMNNIDNSLKKARFSYDEAIGKLSDGRGNLLQQAQKLKKLEKKQKKDNKPASVPRKTQRFEKEEENQEKSLIKEVQYIKELGGIKPTKEIPAVFETE